MPNLQNLTYMHSIVHVYDKFSEENEEKKRKNFPNETTHFCFVLYSRSQKKNERKEKKRNRGKYD